LSESGTKALSEPWSNATIGVYCFKPRSFIVDQISLRNSCDWQKVTSRVITAAVATAGTLAAADLSHDISLCDDSEHHSVRIAHHNEIGIPSVQDFCRVDERRIVSDRNESLARGRQYLLHKHQSLSPSSVEYLPGQNVPDGDDEALAKAAGNIGTTILRPWAPRKWCSRAIRRR
jgi:hypothetical protein